MILIDGKKYACESCIRGHRSSTCNHSDRKLVEIKRKGRPSTACLHCKDLREERNVNPTGSCNCSKLDKSGQLYSMEGDILNRCFCLLGQECKCHSKRKKTRNVVNKKFSFKKEKNEGGEDDGNSINADVLLNNLLVSDENIDSLKVKDSTLTNIDNVPMDNIDNIDNIGVIDNIDVSSQTEMQNIIQQNMGKLVSEDINRKSQLRADTYNSSDSLQIDPYNLTK